MNNLEVLCRACAHYTPVCVVHTRTHTHTTEGTLHPTEGIHNSCMYEGLFFTHYITYVLSCIRRPPPLTFNRSIVHCSWTLIFGPFLPHALAE